jgi:hypothetical protein
LALVVGIVFTLAFFPAATQKTDTFDFNIIHAFQVDETNDLIPFGFLYVPLVMLVWSRGFSLGRTLLTPVGVGFQMRIGMLVYFFLALIGTQGVRDRLLILLPLFFAAALMSTALARASTLQIDEETQRSRFGLSWLGFLTGSVLVITLGGFFMALVFAGIDQSKVLQVMEWIAVGVLTLLFIIFTPVFWVVERLIYFFRQFEFTNAPEQIESGGRIIPGKADDVDRIEWFDTLNSILGFLSDISIYSAIIIGVSLTVIFWVVVFFVRDPEGLVDEDSESIDDREIIGGLQRTISKQFKKIGDAINAIRRFGFRRGLVGVLTIRWAYARMENEARKRGYPRAKAQTPYEFRYKAAKAYPGGEAYIKTITDAYVAIRYGELPESTEELDKVRRALDELMAIEVHSSDASSRPANE